MNYNIHSLNNSLKEYLIKINDLDNDLIDISNFEVDYNLKPLIKFKNIIEKDLDKKFLIVGDYDCDGICATTIIKLLFNSLNVKSNYFIPSRLKQGYGIDKETIEIAYKNDFECLLLLDNGINAIEEINRANELGISVYIIDHHEYQELPDAKAILHSNFLCSPYLDLCTGSLTCLLANCFNNNILYTIYGGLASLADMVKVIGYNRFLLINMLNLLKENDIDTISLLLGNNEISYESLSFNVIPKINAVSRLEKGINANHVVKYLLKEDMFKYLSLIERINQERKDLSNIYYQEAINVIDENKDIIVYTSKTIPEGICGIIANRLMYEYNKAIIVLSEKENEYIGSGRAPTDFNLYEFLKIKEELYSSYGGHNHAIGIKIDKDKFNSFCEYLNNSEINYPITSKDVILIDQDNLDLNLLKQLEQLKPFGSGFNEPIFCIKNIKYDSKFILKNKYPKFNLSNFIEAISFNEKFKDVDFNDMIFQLRRSNYNPNRISLLIEDLI